MEDKNNNEEANQGNHTNKNEEQHPQKELSEQELKAKWRSELENNPAVIAYFKNYFTNPIDHFLENYIDTKYQYLKQGDKYRDQIETEDEHWINEAHTHLEYILQKQLFDKQCRWRAEQITFKEVNTTYDFDFWSYDIVNCPFLEPITAREIEMYQEFLYQSDIEPSHLDDELSWQDYSLLRKPPKEDFDGSIYDPMPEWYQFHNTKTGNSHLLLLPNTRGKKEKYYITLYRENEKQQQGETNQEYDRDGRPFLNVYDTEEIARFVKTFEDKAAQKKYTYYAQGTKNDNNSELRLAFNAILANRELIPVAAHYDIKEAIVKAYNSYYLKKIADHLPIAYEQYRFNKKMGISLATKRKNYAAHHKAEFEKIILDGRELNGEERNFDY